MAYEDGPFVQAACFCNLVLEDKTNALSLIRIIDNLTHTAQGPNPPEDMPPVKFEGTFVVMLKSGRARGRSNLRIVPEFPSGETQDAPTLTVHFDGEEKGTNAITTINIVFPQEGLYWFHVYVDDTKLTSVPFRVRYHRVASGGAAG